MWRELLIRLVTTFHCLALSLKWLTHHERKQFDEHITILCILILSWTNFCLKQKETVQVFGVFSCFFFLLSILFEHQLVTCVADCESNLQRPSRPVLYGLESQSNRQRTNAGPPCSCCVNAQVPVHLHVVNSAWTVDGVITSAVKRRENSRVDLKRGVS